MYSENYVAKKDRNLNLEQKEYIVGGCMFVKETFA